MSWLSLSFVYLMLTTFLCRIHLYLSKPSDVYRIRYWISMFVITYRLICFIPSPHRDQTFTEIFSVKICMCNWTLYVTG